MKTNRLFLLTVLGLFLTSGLGFSQSSNNDNQEIDQMHDLILQSKHKELDVMLNNGADVDAVDEVKNTPLMFASKIGDKKIVDLLIKHGANVNHQNLTGTTPLMVAAKYGNKYTIQKLLEFGADPTIENESGYTAYAFAIAYERKDISGLVK